ncbi:MAG TPA: DNA gyrase inhibitor YacG, partial [Candidatus Binatia bacterium]|nr:DNA gyrase inhibitor YacG [Candidatus Binatia bacterium]
RRETEWQDNPHRPFCSDRCKLIDLGAWAEEKYRIPGSKLEPEPDDSDEDDEAER